MAASTTGRYKDGKKKGWRWEIYPDPASPTGWTKKEWNPKDTSNGGRPAEYFDWHDYDADLEDAATQAATSASRSAQTASDRQALVQRQDAADRQREAELDRSYGEKDTDREFRAREAEADRRIRKREIETRLKEDRRQFDLTFGLQQQDRQLDRDKFGLSVVEANAKMRGPLDYFQGAAAARGSGAYGNYLTAFANGTVPGYGGGTGGTANPTPLTVGTMAREISGEGPSGLDAFGRPLLKPEQQRALDVIDQKFRGGLANAKQGEFENLTEGELDAFKSGGAYLGRNVDDEFTFWRRSRPGQRSALLG